MPLLQEYFNGKAITTEITGDRNLITGLKKRIYQLVIIHDRPVDTNIFCQRYLDEQLCITLPLNHPLASREALTFADLEGMSILAHGNSGFWLDICRQNLKRAKLLVQDSIDMLHGQTNYLVLRRASASPSYFSFAPSQNGCPHAVPAHGSRYLPVQKREVGIYSYPVFPLHPIHSHQYRY